MSTRTAEDKYCDECQAQPGEQCRVDCTAQASSVCEWCGEGPDAELGDVLAFPRGAFHPGCETTYTEERLRTLQRRTRSRDRGHHA